MSAGGSSDSAVIDSRYITARQRETLGVDLRLDPFFSREAASQGGRLVFLPLGPWVGGHVGGLEALDGDMGVDLCRGEAGVAQQSLHAAQVGAIV